MQPSELAEKLRQSLLQWGVTAKVLVRGKDTLEVRMETADLLAEQFAVKPATAREAKIRTHADIPARKPRTAKPKEPERHKGFNIRLADHKDCMSEKDRSALMELTKKYSFISSPRAGSNVWEATCREVIWMASGLFTDSHRWDSKWVSRTTAKGGGPSILRHMFSDIPSVIAALKECLDYVEDAHKNGGYWYPSLENGKMPRKSLASFMATATKAGTEWSPMCEVMWEMHKDAAIKSTLPRTVATAAEAIINDSEYLSGLSQSGLSAYWSGVKKFVDWYYASRDSLMSDAGNRVRLADAGMAVSLVREWNASLGGRVVPATFIYPGTDKWPRFVSWCHTRRNVSLPNL